MQGYGVETCRVTEYRHEDTKPDLPTRLYLIALVHRLAVQMYAHISQNTDTEFLETT